MENSKKWVELLKEGDEVILYTKWGEKICKVEKITPSGLIKVCGSLYNKDGRIRGGSVWDSAIIAEATKERRQKVRNDMVINECIHKMRKRKTISPLLAKKILELLDSEVEE